MIKLPLYRDRYIRGLLYSFILSIDRTIADVYIEDDEIVIKHARGGEAAFLIADVFKIAYEKCNTTRGFGIKFSGNDNRYILPKIRSELSLPPDAGLCEMLKSAYSMIEDFDDTKFNNLFYKGKRVSPLSILRLEHYAVGRLPYFKSLDLNRGYPSSIYAPSGYTVIESLMLLSGYLLSKCGDVPRGDARVSLILLPTHIYSAKIQYYRLVEVFREKSLPPSLEPEYSLYLWLLMTLPKEIESADVYGIKEPAGMKPSEPVFEIEINIAGTDQMRKIVKILVDEYGHDVLDILKASLSKDVKNQDIKDHASKYARYLYQIISPDYEACRELLYTASRDYIILDRYLRKLGKGGRDRRIIRDKLELAMKAYRISKGLLRNLLMYRVPPL